MIEIGNNDFWLYRQSVLNPNSPAIISAYSTVSYKNFHELSLITASFFGSLGISENENVGLLLNHNYNFLIAVNALWMLGAVPVPINTRLLPDEISHQLKFAGIRNLVSEKYFAAKSGAINEIKFIFIDEIAQKDRPHNFSPVKFNTANNAVIIFTSGSSGNPKAVVHTFENLYNSAQATDSFADFNSGHKSLASLPMFHIGGFMIPTRSVISGGTVCFPESLEHSDIETAIKNLRPEIASIVPTTLKRFLDDEFNHHNSFKYVFLGGGPSEADLSVAAFKKGWPIVKVYGSTETCSMVTALNPNQLISKPLSSGAALNGNVISISSENREIEVSCDYLFKEYLNDPGQTSAKKQKGIYLTGDAGSIDENGFLFIDSRLDDIILSGGENISAIEIENVIGTINGVIDVHVFGIKDDNWGQLVCAAINSNSLSAEEIKSVLKSQLAPYKIPKKYFFINSIPRTELGKVNKPELLKMLNLN